MGVCTQVIVYGGQWVISGRQFSPSTLWVLGIDIRASRLHTGAFTPRAVQAAASVFIFYAVVHFEAASIFTIVGFILFLNKYNITMFLK